MTHQHRQSPHTAKSTRALRAACLACATLLPSIGTAGIDDFTGEVFITGSNFCPRSTYEADGRMLAVEDDKPLASVLGSRFGGDGITEFALPDLRPYAARGTRYCIVHSGIYPELP